MSERGEGPGAPGHRQHPAAAGRGRARRSASPARWRCLPYSVRQVTQRSKGRRDRGERGDRGDRGDREGELRDIPGPIDRPERAAPTRWRSTKPALDEFDDDMAADDGRATACARRRRHERPEGDDSMRIVLRDDVDNLGKKGDLVDVADGYARNYLVPRGLALKASAGSQKQADAMRRNREARERRDARGGAGAGRAVRGAHDLDQGARRRRRPSVRFGHRRPTSPKRCRSRPAPRSTAASSTLDEPLKELGGVDLQVRLHPDVVATIHVEVEAAG